MRQRLLVLLAAGVVCGAARAMPAFLPVWALPAGWQAGGEAKTYGPDDLYEYIDGAAPGFLRYDFKRLTVQPVHRTDDPKTEIAVEVYEFGRHLDAFGMYSTERSPDLSFLKLGAEGYSVGPACRFYTGPYYVKLNASRTDDAVKAVESGLAATVAQRLRGETKPPAVLAAFPREALAAASIRYEGSDLLAHDFLGAGFTADYALGGTKPSKLFFAVKASPAAARDAYYGLIGFLRQRGEVGDRLALAGGTARAVRHPFYGPSVVGYSGPVVCGVLRAPSNDAAIKLLDDLLARLDPDAVRR